MVYGGLLHVYYILLEMDLRKPKNGKLYTSQEIRDFTLDAYDYIWSKQTFFKPGVKENFLKGFSFKCSVKDGTKYVLKFKNRSIHFTRNIGKAISVSQFLLRDYFLNFFKFLTPEENYFKREVKLLWLHWIHNRNNIFVKVIETLAIIAEAFLFCDYHLNLKLELNEMSEWFIEWFEEKLSAEFYKCGGWENLEPPSDSWYVSMFYFMDDMIDKSYDPYHSDNSKEIYTCEIINGLRKCGLKFPVPESLLCSNCQKPGDKNFYLRTVYVRLFNEKEEGINLTKTSSRPIHLPAKIRRKFKCDLSKDENYSSKFALKELLMTEKSSTILKQADFSIQPKYNCSVMGNYRDLNEADNKTSHPENRTLSINYSTKNAIYSREINCQREQREFSNSIVERPPEKSSLDNIQTENILQKDVYNYKHTDTRMTQDVYNYKYTDTSTNFDGKIHSSIASSSSEKNYIKEFSAERNDVLITRFQAESPNVIRLNDGTFTKFSPVLTNNLKQTLAPKESLPTKSVLKTVRPLLDSSNKQDTNELLISFHKSNSFENCMQLLQKATIGKDYEVKRPSNRFFLISNKYCNSFETMFKAYLYDFSEENLKNVDISEVPIKTPGDTKYQNEINASNALFSLKFKLREYRYYLIGEE